MLYLREDILAMISLLRKTFLLRSTCIKRNGLLTVFITRTRVTLKNILISSIDHQTHFLTNTRILYFFLDHFHACVDDEALQTF